MLTESESPQIIFREEDHSYWHGEKELMGVTASLTACGFYQEEYFTEESRQRGKAVHLATQFLDEGRLDSNTLDPAIVGYVEAYRAFKFERQFQPDSIEKVVWNLMLGLAGTYDRIGMLKLERWLIDIKTGVVDDVAGLQLAGYNMCLPTPLKRMAVQLKPDGSYVLHPFTDPMHRKIFTSSLAVAQWKKINLRRH